MMGQLLELSRAQSSAVVIMLVVVVAAVAYAIGRRSGYRSGYGDADFEHDFDRCPRCGEFLDECDDTEKEDAND